MSAIENRVEAAILSLMVGDTVLSAAGADLRAWQDNSRPRQPQAAIARCDGLENMHHASGGNGPFWKAKAAIVCCAMVTEDPSNDRLDAIYARACAIVRGLTLASLTAALSATAATSETTTLIIDGILSEPAEDSNSDGVASRTVSATIHIEET